MKNLLILVAFAAVIPAAQASNYTDTARVLSATPNYQQVSVPHQVCSMVMPAATPAPQGPVGVGSVLGGVAGALLGAQVGQGNGRIAAAAVGAATGALAGQSIQQSQAAPPQPVQSCQTVYHTVEQANGYQVAYSYAGRQFSTVLPYDPGQRLQVVVEVHPAR